MRYSALMRTCARTAERIGANTNGPGETGAVHTCGGWGIRTPEGLHPTRFPSVRHRPLGESSRGLLTHPPEPGYPCCVSALGELAWMAPREEPETVYPSPSGLSDRGAFEAGCRGVMALRGSNAYGTPEIRRATPGTGCHVRRVAPNLRSCARRWAQVAPAARAARYASKASRLVMAGVYPSTDFSRVLSSTGRYRRNATRSGPCTVSLSA